jgi:hypothetical protein
LNVLQSKFLFLFFYFQMHTTHRAYSIFQFAVFGRVDKADGFPRTTSTQTHKQQVVNFQGRNNCQQLGVICRFVVSFALTLHRDDGILWRSEVRAEGLAATQNDWLLRNVLLKFQWFTVNCPVDGFVGMTLTFEQGLWKDGLMNGWWYRISVGLVSPSRLSV